MTQEIAMDHDNVGTPYDTLLGGSADTFDALVLRKPAT
jgi:hypothetical protein